MEEKIAAKVNELVAELNKVRSSISQIDQQVAQLRTNREQILAQGLELQGAIKHLQELLPKSE